MPNCILHMLQEPGSILRGLSTKQTSLQYRTVNHCKHLVPHEMKNMAKETPNCWATEILYQPKMGERFKTLSKLQQLASWILHHLPSGVKSRVDETQCSTCPSPNFLVLAWNSKWADIFLSFNKLPLFYFQWNIGLCALQIVIFCFYFHLTQCRNLKKNPKNRDVFITPAKLQVKQKHRKPISTL